MLPSTKQLLEAIQNAISVYTGPGSEHLGMSSTIVDEEIGHTPHLMLEFENPMFDIEDDDSEFFIVIPLHLHV